MELLMSNNEILKILKKGADHWNKWRSENRSNKIDFSKTNLTGLNLADANLSRIDLSYADLSGSDLSRVNLHNSVLEGSKLVGTKLCEANLCEMNLSGADIKEANLSKAHLGGTNLVEADLSFSDLRYASISYAGFHNATLTETVLANAVLLSTGLLSANLNEADLRGVSLIGSNLLGADLSNVKLGSTKILDCILSEVNGLNLCQHQGPSYLDLQTLQKSGPLPPDFLRGCGLSDSQINYLKALHTQPIQFYSCFISYSTKDKAFAKRMHADLQNEGVRCWYAPEDIKSGKKLHEQIDEAIKLHDKLLLILSKNSMDSEWVKTEIAKARHREVHEKCRVLFPISLIDYESIMKWECFDADTGKDSAKEIREYYIPDFSKWKDHDKYKESFDRLIKDLKQELGRKPA